MSVVETYIRAWQERDPDVRARLLEQCFAAEGRFVTRNRVFQGRAALAQLMARTHADPELVAIRVVGAIDAVGKTFRFRAVVDRTDGTSPETLEAGELDDAGLIATVLTFTGPLA
ncbi:Hypothetical protein A7982_08119 [Minicystis rosea]|nr:Hypothetical protein A7982_08119 [Minicystis rosea]